MNITLSADEKLIEKVRNYANKHNTTLNGLIREHLKKIVNEAAVENSADEFEMIAVNYGGNSKGATLNKRKKSSNRR